MKSFFDEDFWWRSLSKPNWYLLIADDFRRIEKLAQAEHDEVTRKQIKRNVYDIVERALREKHIPLAKEGENLDQERQPISLAIIHHTKNQPGMQLERLDAMQLLRIYGMYYANPNKEEEHLQGKPVWSGHFYKGQQVFWGYHWLVRQDGTIERILEDQHIGWHAGNWDVNTKSVGICIDGDLSSKEPAQEVLESVTRLIKDNYPRIKPEAILGHCEVNLTTECPGALFLSSWKPKLHKPVT